MKTILGILSVLGFGAAFFWGAFPAGYAAGFPLLFTCAVAAAGGIGAVLLVTALGRPLQAWAERRFARRLEKIRAHRIHRIWEKYGVIGLGLLSPVLFGAPQCTLLGLLFGAPPARMAFWASCGVLVWTALVGGLILLGVTGITG
jgi:hypothetical protein